MSNSQRHQRAHSFTVPATAEKVFPLLCPIRELDWLQPWRCEVKFSTSGLAELDCVFTTDFRGGGEVIVTCTRYEPNRAIDYLFVTPNATVTRLSIALADQGDGNTLLHWVYVSTAIGPGAVESFKRFEKGQYEKEMKALELSLCHYLKTGEMLRIMDES